MTGHQDLGSVKQLTFFKFSLTVGAIDHSVTAITWAEVECRY